MFEVILPKTNIFLAIIIGEGALSVPFVILELTDVFVAICICAAALSV